MIERPRVLLVAVGGYGVNFLNEMTQRDTGADITGIVEVMPAIEERCPVIKERSIPVFPTMDAFYAAGSADLAVLASPIHLHTQMVITALEHGSHVLCEKPLCLTEAEAHEMEAAAQKAGRFLAVGYQFDYQRDVWALKKDILSGRFGRPLRMEVVHAMRRGRKYYTRNTWAGTIISDGHEVFDSPFTNACAHYFQLMTFLLGNDMRSACGITGVTAELYRGNPKLENFDTAAMRFETDCGAPIFYYTSHALYAKKLGPWGVFEFENATVTFGQGSTTFKAVLNDGTEIDYSTVHPGERMQKLYDAVECVKHGGKPICGTEAEYPHIRAVRLVQACPVKDVAEENCYIVEEDGDVFRCIRGLEEIFESSARSWKLPSEMGHIL